MRVPNLPDRTTGDITPTYFDRQWAYIVAAVNGGLTFGTPGTTDGNIRGVWFKGTTPSNPDTDFTIPLNLGRIPTGWLLVSIDKPAVVYKGSVAWTQSSITLRCNTASTNVTLLVI